MEGTIVVSPGLPEVAPENAESLGFLSELISDSLGRLDSLKRSASTAILDLLEANVRLGWYLEDARHFLRKEGTYVAWIEQTCPLSYGHTTRLRQLSKHFCRDSIDNLQRLKLGISIPGLLENGEHLRRQIAASQCGSMADMFRYAGLLPSPDRAVASGSNGNGEHANSNAKRVKEFEHLLATMEKKTIRTNPERLSTADREKLISRMKPLVSFYSSLRGESSEPSCRFSASDFR
jgi:hypothetical protein